MPAVPRPDDEAREPVSDTLTDLGRRALLPAGLRDVLPPNAGNEARLVELMVARAAAHGYERVTPPLIEFADRKASCRDRVCSYVTIALVDGSLKKNHTNTKNK